MRFTDEPADDDRMREQIARSRLRRQVAEADERGELPTLCRHGIVDCGCHPYDRCGRQPPASEPKP